MSYQGVILYGPPASGKDAITSELCDLDHRYVLFRRLKAGGGRRSGYRMTTHEKLDELRSLDKVLYENDRYGNTYVIDVPELERLRERGKIPVIHIGQVEGIERLRNFGWAWLQVLLWCPRAVALRRLQAREGSDDVEQRLRAWDETEAELRSYPRYSFAVSVATDEVLPREAGRLIHVAMSTNGDR